MTSRQSRWFAGFWLVLLCANVGLLTTVVGGWRALLLALLIVTLGQMGYGMLCRRVGKLVARWVYRFAPLLLVPGMLLFRGAASDVTGIVFDTCQLLATVDWSNDDIGGWGRRRWAQVKSMLRRFSQPVMGGLHPRA